MAKHFHSSDVILRFIEFMDVGSTNQWQLDDVFSAKQIAALINQELPIQPAKQIT